MLTLQLRNANVVDIDSVVSGVSTDDAAINTELEVIRSRSLIKKLVEDLELDKDPEFNASLRPDPKVSLDMVTQWVRSQISSLLNSPSASAQEGPLNTEPTLNRVITNVRRSISRQANATPMSSTSALRQRTPANLRRSPTPSRSFT